MNDFFDHLEKVTYDLESERISHGLTRGILLCAVSAAPPAPAQEVGLTDEEIRRNWSGGACPDWGIKFARAIIAALRAKGRA